MTAFSLRKVAGAALAVLIALNGLPVKTAGAAAAPAYDVNISGADQQTVKGWGVFPSWNRADWNRDFTDKTGAQQALFEDLGATLFRVMIPAVAGDGDGNLIDAKMQEIYDIVGAGETRGMHDYIISVWSPPIGMKTLPTVNGWTGSEHVRLRPEKEEAYANYLVNAIHWLTDKGASVPKALSFQNEPLSQIVSEWCYWGGDNGTQYQRFAKLLRAKLDAAGLTDVEILGPEGAAYHENELLLGEDFSALRSDPALNAAIGGLASHSYFAKGFDNNDVYKNFRAALDQVPDKDLWQTEYSTLISGVSEMDMAINAAERLAGDMALIRNNYWFWWLGWANGRHPTDVGEVLLDGDGYTVTKSKAFYVLSNLFNRVPVGSKVRRISADPASGLTTADAVWMDAVAFVNGSQTVALLVNPTNEAKTVNVNGLTGTTASVYQLTADIAKGQDMQLAALRNVQGGTASAVVLPARSVSVIATSDEDQAPPHIVFDQSGSTEARDADYAVRESQFTVSGHLDEAGTLQINGQAVPVAADNGFSTTVALQPGDNTITAVATDEAGNAGEPVTLFVRHDPAYLGLSLDQSGTLYANQSAFTVSGRTNGTASVTVKQTAGGETVTEATYQVGSPDGSGGTEDAVIRQILNDNFVSAGAGLTAAQGGFTTNAQVVWDSSSVFAPAEGDRSLRLKLSPGFARVGLNFLNASNQAISEDYSAVSNSAELRFAVYTKSKVDSLSAVLESDNGGTVVEARLPLSDYIAASDYGAKWTQVAIPLRDFDAAPHYVAGTGEATSLPVAWSSVRAVGFTSNHTVYYDPYIDDLKIVQPGVSDDGSAGGTEDGGTSASLAFSAPLDLRPGENTIAVTAVNRLNQTAAPASVTVVYDPDPPVLTLPADGTTTGTSFVLNGSVNEDAVVTVNGTPAALKPDRTFTAVVPVSKGENAITVVAKDPAGNVAQAVVRVTADPVEDGSLAPGVAYSAKTGAAPTIDGDLTESGWSVNNRVEKRITGTSDNSVTFGTMWDAGKLYVALKVLDANLVNDTAGAQTYQDDSVEIYLDGDNARGSVYGTDDHQITLGWHDDQLSVGGDIAGIAFAQHDIDGGFTVELAIPWSGIGVQPPQDNAVIGFDAAYNDDDGGNGGLRESQLMWRGNADDWRSTAAFGSLYLSGGKNASVAREPSGSLTVDGALDEPAWSLRGSVAKAITGTSNNSVRFGTLADTQNLYVGVEVLDADLRNDSEQAYQDDSVEIYLDADHNEGAAYDAYDHQLTLGWHDGQLSMIGSLANVQYAQKDINGGYSVELAIPWSSLNVSPARDITLGFDVGNNDDDGGNAGNRESQLMWSGSGDNWRDTSGFGDLLIHNLSLPLPDHETPEPEGLAEFADDNADLSKLYEKSAHIVNASGHPENFADDATRIAHNIDNPTSPEYVVYQSPEGDIYSFDITTGLFSNTPQFTFYGSADGVNFTKITAASKLTGGANGYAVFSNTASGLPAGTKYLKIVFPGLENWKEQLMNVAFKYFGDAAPPDDGESAVFTDEAGDLTKLFGKSGHIVNALGGQVEKYGGDGTRIVHANDDSLEPEYVIYQSPDGDIRSLEANVTNWTGLPDTVTFSVYGSADGQSFAELPVHSQMLGTAGGYDTFSLSVDDIPAGIQYVKIVFPYGDPACDNWTSTINRVTFTYGTAGETPDDGPVSATASLTGETAVIGGQNYELTYGLSEVQGAIAAEDLKLHYDPAMFDFGSAAEVKPGFAIVGQSAVPGEVRLVLAAEGAENALTEDGDVLRFTFKAKTPDASAASVISVSGNVAANLSGEETQLQNVDHQVLVTVVDKSALIGLIAQAQGKLDASEEGTHPGQYPAGAKALLQAAVQAAQTVVDNAAAAQPEADGAVTALQTAVQTFDLSLIQSGDLNGDGRISAGDIAMAARYYGKQSSDAGWNETYRYADMNGDGLIDVADFKAIASLILA